GVRRRFPAAALVEQDDVVEFRVEDAPLLGRGTAAGAAMQEDGGLGAFRADPLPVDGVSVADIEHAGLEGCDLGIEGAQVSHDVLSAGGHWSVSWSGCW